MNILEMPKIELLQILKRVLDDYDEYTHISPFICSNINRRSKRYLCESGQLLELAEIYSVDYLTHLTDEERVNLKNYPHISKAFWAPSNKTKRKEFLKALISKMEQDV